MTTYVLVHGGFAGGWQWRKVAGILRQAGHDVFTPTLTGMGERCHLARPEVDLETHIQDIVNVFEFEEIEQAILVGFSYSGMVIRGAADRIPGRIAHLVYLDAFIPEDGQRFADLIGPQITAIFQQRAQKFGNGWLVTPDPTEVDSTHRMTPQPHLTALSPICLRNPHGAALPRTFIYCTADKNPLPLVWVSIAQAAEQARHSPDWRYAELPTHHMAMDSMPTELAGILLEIAHQTRSTTPAVSG
jgi:pimeloyl-ACP methyl ester carboxylesterase